MWQSELAMAEWGGIRSRSLSAMVARGRKRGAAQAKNGNPKFARTSIGAACGGALQPRRLQPAGRRTAGKHSVGDAALVVHGDGADLALGQIGGMVTGTSAQHNFVPDGETAGRVRTLTAPRAAQRNPVAGYRMLRDCSRPRSSTQNN